MIEELNTLQQIYATVVDFLVNYSFQLVGAVLILIVGVIVGSWVARALLRALERRNLDVTLRQFIASTARLAVIVLFVIIALSKLGISMTPLIAAVGGLALGASFAIQGPVSNYGAGLVIILTRMFKVGDTITVQACSGVVEEITLAVTRLRAEDGEDIVIPNKHIVGEIHRNSYAYQVVESEIGIAYQADPRRAIDIINGVLDRIDGVAAAPSAQVGIDAFRDAGIAVAYRYWAPTRRYIEVKHAVNAAVYQALTEAGINILPQREVRFVQHH